MNDFVPLLIFILIPIGLEILIPLFRKSPAPKCKHGVKKGNTIENGKYKCAKCQLEHEEYLLESKRKAECREREVLFRDCVLNAIKKRKQCIYDDLNEIYSLSPKDFEDMVANLYRHLGFNVTQTPYINDGGKDAILSKDGIRYFLECKRYSPDAQIGRPMLQKLFAAMNEGHVEHGIFITTADFSKTAYEYGTRYGIQTINGQALVELIRDNVSLSDVQHEYLIPCLQCGEMISFPLFDGDENKKCCNGHNVNNIFYKNGNNSIICLRCGKKMELRSGRRGKFYGCTDYPKCNFTISPENYRIATGEQKKVRIMAPRNTRIYYNIQK